MIGIFGGTFDPIHYGHLRSALEVKTFFQLRQVRLVPCARPPHRTQPHADAEHRIAMLKLALAEQDELVCDPRELHRAGVSYTIDTLIDLQLEFVDERLFLFIGADAFAQLPHWQSWRELFNYAHIVVLTRPDNVINWRFNKADYSFLRSCYTQNKQDLQQKTTGCLLFHTVTPLAISATAIRHCLAQQGNPRFLLPDAVLTYINQHQLYKNY